MLLYQKIAHHCEQIKLGQEQGISSIKDYHTEILEAIGFPFNAKLFYEDSKDGLVFLVTLNGENSMVKVVPDLICGIKVDGQESDEFFKFLVQQIYPASVNQGNL